MTIRGLSMLCSYTWLPISSTTMSPTSAYTHTHTQLGMIVISGGSFYRVVLVYFCLFVLVLVSRVLGHSKSSSFTPLPTPPFQVCIHSPTYPSCSSVQSLSHTRTYLLCFVVGVRLLMIYSIRSRLHTLCTR